MEIDAPLAASHFAYPAHDNDLAFEGEISGLHDPILDREVRDDPADRHLLTGEVPQAIRLDLGRVGYTTLWQIGPKYWLSAWAAVSRFVYDSDRRPSAKEERVLC